MLFWHFEPFWSNPVSFSHVQCIYILVLLLYKKLQLFIDGGGKSMTKTYWNHFEMSLLTTPPPPRPQKVHHIFIITIFDSHTCTVTSVLGLYVDLRKVIYNLKVPLLNINLSGLF